MFSRGMTGRRDVFIVDKPQMWLYDSIQKCANKTVIASLTQEFNDKNFYKYRFSLDDNIQLGEYLDADQFNEFYKIIFIRDPFTRFISSYLYMFSENCKDIGMFNDILNAFENCPNFKYANRHWAPMNSVSKWSSNSSYDFIGTFENLEADLLKLQNELGLPEIVMTIDYHKTNSSNFIGYLEYELGGLDSLRKRIANIYKEDYDRFSEYYGV